MAHDTKKKPALYYQNRELSWIQFNERVLEEALCEKTPLFERLRFTSIFQSNLDEFFRVRFGALQVQKETDPKHRDSRSGMTAADQQKAVCDAVQALEPQRDQAYHALMMELRTYGLEQVTMQQVTKSEYAMLEELFHHELRPLLLPLLTEKGEPLPFLANGAIYAVLHLSSKAGVRLGILPVSSAPMRMVSLSNDGKRFILAEDVILHFAPTIFKSFQVIDKTLIRVTRSAQIDPEAIAAEGIFDQRQVMETLLRRREKLPAVRLQLSESFSAPAVDYLRKQLNLKKRQIFQAKAPLDLSFINDLGDLPLNHSLFYERRIPQKSHMLSENRPMIPQIKRRDILLSYPYESMRPFIRLLNEAAEDDRVLSIQITLYRMARNSQVIEALCAAAENGKRVVAFVELRARFDEENNINWSRVLQRSGCEVLFGLPGYKVHSKLCLITRKASNGVEYITQIGTGNYNEKTSQIYTDFSLMTAHPQIGSDANSIFRALSENRFPENLQQLLAAPLCLRNHILEWMDEEIELAKQGKPAYIGAKINSLSDRGIIDKLAEASKAGVQIELVIRGICCLKAGIPNETEGIQIRSIVGRYLEHSRIYIFGAEERRRLYISSADYMSRNTMRRVEVAAPILDAALQERVWNFFRLLMQDNVKARIQTEGDYLLTTPEGTDPIHAQAMLMEEAVCLAEQKELRKKRIAKKIESSS